MKIHKTHRTQIAGRLYCEYPMDTKVQAVCGFVASYRAKCGNHPVFPVCRTHGYMLRGRPNTVIEPLNP